MKVHPLILIWWYLTICSCKVQYNLQNAIFYHGIILSSESYTTASSYHFNQNHYTIHTTDNTRGNMDMQVIETGLYKIDGNKLKLIPKTVLVCPNRVPAWQSKGQLFFTDSLNTDSFYLSGMQECYDFSEYKLVRTDTLSTEETSLLNLFPRMYRIVMNADKRELRSMDYYGYNLFEFKVEAK